MGDPPDDPGGGSAPPEPKSIETPIEMLISALESSMDTDGSVVTENKLKRKRTVTKVCNTCNKKKRKGSKRERSTDCQCALKECVTNNPLQTENKLPLTSSSSISNPEPILSNPASTSIGTHTPVGRTSYVATDAAPYIVHIQKEHVGENNGVTFHPVTFGRFLKKNSINGIVNGSIKRIGRNRISMSFNNFSDANLFITNSKLNEEKLKAFIPTFTVTRMGVIRGVPTDWEDDEIIENISVPIGCGKIIKMRRLKRKINVNNNVQFVNTGTIVVTFDGQVLPTRVYMCYTALTVDLYIYPTVQCYNCCRYGHVKNQCRSVPRCFKCGQGHSGDTCDVEEDLYYCCLCKGNHQAVNKKCLEFDRQKKIKESMSKSCISYLEAVKLHPVVNKLSYADALLSAPSPSTDVDNYNVSKPHLNFTSQNSTSQSYKKTVFLKPRAPTKAHKGYDRSAHAEITKTPSIQSVKPIFNDNNDTDTSISEVIRSLIQLLNQSNTKVSPPNVALLINILHSVLDLNNGPGGSHDTMELPQCD